MIQGTESPYISRDDETEAAQLRDLNGVGEIILEDDDVRQYSMSDFGFGHMDDRVT